MIALPGVSRELWSLCVALGFAANGSSCSPDVIQGIRIGESGSDYRPDLPANVHDLRYWMARERHSVISPPPHHTPLAQELWDSDFSSSAARRAADLEFWIGLARAVEPLEGLDGLRARVRIGWYYNAVRWRGARFWAQAP